MSCNLCRLYLHIVLEFTRNFPALAFLCPLCSHRLLLRSKANNDSRSDKPLDPPVQCA